VVADLDEAAEQRAGEALPLKCLASDIVETILKRGRQPNGSRHVEELNLEAG
jgi:hypothetical protein